MQSTSLYASCASSDVDSNGQCTHVVWVEQPVVGLPPLTAAQGFQISGAVAACWAVGFLVRVIRKQLGV